MNEYVPRHREWTPELYLVYSWNSSVQTDRWTKGHFGIGKNARNELVLTHLPTGLRVPVMDNNVSREQLQKLAERLITVLPDTAEIEKSRESEVIKLISQWQIEQRFL